MRKIISVLLVITAAGFIVAAFFMPWVSASTSVTRVSKEITNTMGPFGGLPLFDELMSGVEKSVGMVRDAGDINVDMTVSGYDIPKMVNSRSSKTALSFVRNFFRDKEGLAEKSMLVYLLPLLAILCAGLAVVGIKYRSATISMLALSGVISLTGLYKLNTLHVSNEMVDIVILKGLWYTMYGYLSIFIIGILWIVSDIAAKYKKQGGAA